MDVSQKVLASIYAAIDDYNMDIPESDHLDKTPDTLLFDEQGKLDSVGLVTLSTAIETRIEQALGQRLSVFTQEASARSDKPLATVKSLTAYFAQKLGA
jgi:acyl carrier protein